MFGSRRLAKRSIVGSKVSALYKDGRFYPGVIQSQITEDGCTTAGLYSVRFEDGLEKSVTSNNIIGPGFESVQAKTLKNGQRVYITLHGREVSGTVSIHDKISDEVMINLDHTPGEAKQIIRKIEEIRLMESRKSARLSDQDTDYSKLADLAEPKKRTVSHFIDVPAKNPRHRERHNTDQSDDQDDVEMEDESIAALALTNLSCSPASPPIGTVFMDREMLLGPHSYRDNSHLSSSVASSGFYSGISESNDRSPPMKTHMSESAPDRLLNYEASPTDDGLDLEENVKQFYDEDMQQDEKKKSGHIEILYQCTWPKCKTITNTVKDIERHIRTAHLGRDSGTETSDNEEEFYFTEIEVNLENVTEKFSNMMTSSPPGNIEPKSLGVFDHDYQRKENRQNNSGSHASSVPSSGFHMGTSTPIPIKMIDGDVRRSLSWQSHNSSPNAQSILSPIKNSRLSPHQRLQQHQAQSPKSHLFSSSPKSNSVHRKPRSEVRKCRKIYGMENRDQWCTQCKWKKACSRFQD